MKPMRLARLLRKPVLTVALGTIVLMGAGSAHAAPILLEDFDDITTLAGSGWVQTNNSTPGGTTNWFQGNAGLFPSQAGAGNSYIAANFNNAGPGGDISNWLISPNLTFGNGDTISFYTQSLSATSGFPDRLELRLSTSGASTNVGGTTTSVGDFATVLLTINPLLNASYPDSWTLFTTTLSGLGGPTSGRFAFRYDVTDTSNNADYIGIDTVSVETVGAAAVPEPATLTLLGLGLAGVVQQRRRAAKRS